MKRNKRLSGEPRYYDSGTLIWEECCDCGLTHAVNYQIRRIKKKTLIEIIKWRDDWQTKNNREKK